MFKEKQGASVPAEKQRKGTVLGDKIRTVAMAGPYGFKLLVRSSVLTLDGRSLENTELRSDKS